MLKYREAFCVQGWAGMAFYLRWARVKLLFSTGIVLLVAASCAAQQPAFPRPRPPFMPGMRQQATPQQTPSPAPSATPQQTASPTPAVSPEPAISGAPLSAEQQPTSPPQVAFNNGILTIIADNSSLGDILRAVHHQTGATVDIPGNATERVVGKFGPGPVRDVLSMLLNGSHFNYVLLGSATNPNGLDRVMLISKSAGGEEPTQQANAAPPPQQQPTAPVAAQQPIFGGEVSSDDAAEAPQQDQPGEGLFDDQANQQAQQDDQQQLQASPFGQGANVKTPEQLLQELQQRQQQMMQQQQQGGNPQPFAPSPLAPGQPQPQQPQPPQ